MTHTSATKTIQLKRYYVTDGTIKARVRYDFTTLTNGRECVSINSKDYSDNLGKVFNFNGYENNSDGMVDYFERGHVRIYRDNPLFAAAMRMVEATEKAREIRHKARNERYVTIGDREKKLVNLAMLMGLTVRETRLLPAFVVASAKTSCFTSDEIVDKMTELKPVRMGMLAELQSVARQVEI